MSAKAVTATAAPGGRGDGAGSSAVRGVTVIMVLVMGLSFLFGFGNSWALGLHLGVPPYVAPLASRGFSQTEGSSARTQGSNPARTGVDP
ncbi:hypothetical protein Franean1_3033 [Parafrankia sp. EAN1pec]|nr:hypothetical protein Franean1_3033 [Frankia sp. EAN1pec]